ncbi:MAG: hypothetical protein ACT4OT_10320 [Acidobacteriota bacterium]
MSGFSSPLSKVRVASPCPAGWDSMKGDERVRFCGQCELNVYNLSAMTKAQAENLIVRTEGRLCIRFFRRTDGSILTQDCPVGLRALRQRMSRIRRAVASMLLGFFAGSAGSYAVNGFKTAPDEPHTVGVIAVTETHQPVHSPEAGQVETPVSLGRVIYPKRRR